MKGFLRLLATSEVFDKGRAHGLVIMTQFVGDQAMEKKVEQSLMTKFHILLRFRW